MNRADILILSRQTKDDARKAIVFNFFALLAATAWSIWAQDKGRGFVYIIAAILLIVHALYANLNSKNLLFSFRYSLVSILALGTTAAWSYTGELYIAPFGMAYQTHEATSSLVAASLFALIGIHLGWSTGRLLSSSNENNIKYDIELSDFKGIILLSFIVAYVAVGLYVYREGGFVSVEKSYGFDRNSIGVQFGVFNQLILYFVLLLFLMMSMGSALSIPLLIVVLGPFILAILSGNRADFLMQTGLLLFIYYMAHAKIKLEKLPILRLLVLAVMLFYITSFISVWRNNGDFVESLSVFQQSSVFLKDRGGIPTISLATGNQMLGGFYAVYSKLHILGEDLLLGKTYVEYLWMLPPAFLGLPRPPDRAWDMEINGLLMQQGGLYEIVEAYWNFGMIGAFFVPFFITLGMASVLNLCYARAKHHIFYASVFLAIGMNAPRGVWYQTFSYIRLLTILLCMFFAVLLYKTLARYFGTARRGTDWKR
ncbi:O-antigen polysaccharide polymerase Wzy [Stutzerimonas nitrititolerans]|uniref:O-antigen polysaccharide polymerase Wzy n=1 Tax=Stutzerimonas nitrititolerans TaxID=2482751 RepID=UPI001BD29DEC|nr:O-antigen polysaccharide polymerase Wzy [Stutzerimonas nitrititolerans]